MIKRKLFAPRTLITLGVAFCLAVSSFAQTTAPGAKGWAAGAFLGEPTGITVRYGVTDTQSFEAKAAWSLYNQTSLLVQANYLQEFPGVIVIKGQDFPLYVGVGAEVNVGNTFGLGVRIPGGILYRFQKIPLELAFELGIGMQIIPSTSLQGSGGFAVRYRF